MRLSNTLKSVSVGVKLVAGFFTLVVFSIVIAVIAAGALEQYAEHARVVAGTSDVKASLLDARTEEKNFQIRREDQYIKRASAFADDAAERARELSDALTLKADQNRVDAIISGISQYKALLNRYLSNIDDPTEAEAIRKDLVTVARAVVDSAVALQESQLTVMGDEYDQSMTLIVSTAIIVVLLAVILAWLLTRNVTRPIRQTVEIANKVASGDLTVDASSDRGDEFGQLIAAFGTMITNLRALIKEIGQGASSIASSSEELSAVTDQTSAAVTGQRDKTDQVATAMNEMVATVSDVAKSAGAAFDAANNANEKAGQGNAAVAETLKYVSELKAQTDEVMGQLRGLQTETHNIGTILDVIKAVAEQTNLLALNAAIEAARAGEHGRGFAVVADEVRGLAGRTQTSAQEIEGLINNLVASAETSNNNMERSTQLAGQTLESAEATRETIGAVVQSVDEINQYSSQIATASEQQASVAEDINKNVTEIREESDQTASATNQVSSSSRELARLAEELNSQIARFRI